MAEEDDLSRFSSRFSRHEVEDIDEYFKILESQSELDSMEGMMRKEVDFDSMSKILDDLNMNDLQTKELLKDVRLTGMTGKAPEKPADANQDFARVGRTSLGMMAAEARPYIGRGRTSASTLTEAIAQLASKIEDVPVPETRNSLIRGTERFSRLSVDPWTAVDPPTVEEEPPAGLDQEIQEPASQNEIVSPVVTRTRENTAYLGLGRQSNLLSLVADLEKFKESLQESPTHKPNPVPAEPQTPDYKEEQISPEFERQIALNQSKVPHDTMDDDWQEEVAKLIQSGQAEHLHEKNRIDKSKISSIASTKDVLIKNRNELQMSIKKQREPKVEAIETSSFKLLLDMYDEQEKANMKEIRKKRERQFYSALRESEWNSSELPSVRLDKGELVRQLLKDKYAGNISCFGLSADEVSIMLVGTDQGDFLELDLVKKKVRKEKLGSPVLTVDISPNKELIAAGLESGEVFVKKSGGSWVNKKQRVDDRPINQMRWAGNETLVTSTDRNLHRLVVKDLKVMFDITKTFIVQNCRDIITQICIMPCGALYHVIVTMVAYVRMYLLAEKDSMEVFMIERPEYCVDGAVPSVSWLSPDDKDYTFIIIFWDCYVMLIKNEGQNSVISGMKKLDKQISWGCVLRNRTIAILYQDFQLCLESIHSIFTNLLAGAGFQTKFQLAKSEHTKGRSFQLASDGSWTQAWSESIRCYRNSIYFLKNDGISSMYLLTLKEMAYSYAEQGSWLPALKLCVEVCNKKLRANREEIAEMTAETLKLTTHYIDRFVDRSKRDEELQSRVLRISIDALCATNNLPHLFVSLRFKFDDLVFWREVQFFIENGMIHHIPLKALKDGAMYLQKEELEHIIFHITHSDLKGSIDEVHLIVQIVKKRKLWPSLYRLGLLDPDSNLFLVLSMILSDFLCSEEQAKPLIEQFAAASEEDRKSIFQDASLGSYLRMFWFLKAIVNWHVGGLVEHGQEMEEIWIKTISWLMDPSNIKVLSSVNINAYLETYFDLFLNVEFSTSLHIIEGLKSRVDTIRRHIEGGRQKPLPKSPGKKKSISSEEESMAEEEGSEDTFLAFKAILENLYQFSNPEFAIEISFLALKLVTLSVFKKIYNDSKFLISLVMTILSKPFSEGKLWFNYEIIKKEDFEEKVVRVISQIRVARDFGDFIIEMENLAVDNGFTRIHAFLIEITKGPIDALKNYIKTSKTHNCHHLFNWIKKCILETKSEQTKVAFCREVMRNLGRLVDAAQSDGPEHSSLEGNSPDTAVYRTR